LYSLNPTSSVALHLFGTKWSKTLEEKSYHTAEVYFYKLVGVLLIKQLTQHMSYTKGIRRRHPSYLSIISIPYNLLFNHRSSLPCANDGAIGVAGTKVALRAARRPGTHRRRRRVATLWSVSRSMAWWGVLGLDAKAGGVEVEDMSGLGATTEGARGALTMGASNLLGDRHSNASNSILV
jgi:hypothetical protein